VITQELAGVRQGIHPNADSSVSEEAVCCVGYFRVSYLEKTLLTADQKA
jgi:hypothetical protein